MPKQSFQGGIAPQDRARQFIPFMALKGYFDLCLEKERHPAPRHALTEEEAMELSRVISTLHKGSMASVTYYDRDAYVMRRGIVSEVVPQLGFIRIVRQRIDFNDILRVEVDESEQRNDI